MKLYKNILLIGGTGRNVGKTSLVCELIKRFSSKTEIIGLKITNHFHLNQNQNFNFIEETDTSGLKDSSKMLLAGATKVFYIEAEAKNLQAAFDFFIENQGNNKLIICESNGLSEIITPGVFLLVDRNNNSVIKSSAKKAIAKINAVVEMENNSFRHVTKLVSISDSAWKFC